MLYIIFGDNNISVVIMNEEECYCRIIACLEKSTVTLASYMLGNLKYFLSGIKDKKVVKNCIIIILSYFNDHKIITDYKKGIEVNILKNDQKQEALNILQNEFLSN